MPSLPHRKSTRLTEFNYSSAGWYFVTICTQDKQPWFGEIRNGSMVLNELGCITEGCFMQIPDHFKHVSLDEFVIMPNHVHGIIVIESDPVITTETKNTIVGDRYICPLRQKRNTQLLPEVISKFKAAVSRNIHHKNPDLAFSWQRSYYDHIIRNEKSYWEIKRYIFDNPRSWQEDENYIENGL